MNNDILWLNKNQQIEKNKNDIEELSTINGLLGIKVVNQVDSEADLPAEDSEEFMSLEYGDAYIIDNLNDTYTFFVKTRPTSEKDYDHWFRLQLAGLKGDTGEIGPKGEPGPIGFKAYATNDINVIPLTDKLEGHTAMLQDGRVYRVLNGQWYYITTIVGGQGEKGLKGDTGERGDTGATGATGPKGDPGGFIHIVGQVTAPSQLPVPPEDPTAAYFVGAEYPVSDNPIYIWAGEPLRWQNIGVLNIATYVTSNGEYVGIWDADTKVDKISSTGSSRAYGVDEQGTQRTYDITASPYTNTIAFRASNGRLRVGTPTLGDDAATKQYVDSNLPKIIRI